MKTWKMPPKEKVYEAFSVIADSRYEILENGKATVLSSNRDKRYNIEWIEISTIHIKITSNDNASYWRGYAGYPIVAMLLVLDKVQFNESIAQLFKNINWNVLNKESDNNYTKAVDKILSSWDESKVECIRKEVDLIYERMSELTLERIDKGEEPPKSNLI